MTQPPIWSMLVRLSVSGLYWSLMALLPVHAFIRGIDLGMGSAFGAPSQDVAAGDPK